METFIPSSSPLFRYTPCNSCDPSTGFSSSSDSSGQFTSAGNTSVAVNFTGTSISFLLDDLPASFTSSVLVDGQPPTSSANVTATSVSNLPYGTYEFTLLLRQPADGNGTRFLGINGGLGSLYTAQSQNYTVDDTAWRDWKVALSPAWNMLERGASNWINNTQYDAQLQTADNNFNGSISWTEKANASTTITFNGSAVWAFGITGGVSGSYEVILNNQSRGTYNASGGPTVYQSILYHASGLSDGPHNLTLRNLEEGKRLSFDYLNSTSGLLPVPDTASAPAPPPPPPSPSSADSHSPILNTGTIVAIAVASSVAVIVLILVVIIGIKRARRKPKKEKEPSIKPLTTFWRWSAPSAPPPLPKNEKGRPFQPLPSPPVSSSQRVAPFAAPFTRWPSPPATDRSEASPEPTQTSFLKLSKSPTRKTLKAPRADSAGSNHLPPESAMRSGEFLDMGALKPKSRMHIPFFAKTKLHSSEDNPETYTDLPSPRFSHALAAAVNGQTSSPLSELRDSYFPSMKPVKDMSKKKRKGSTGSVSIRTDFTGLDDRPMTPGGILDGYKAGDGKGGKGHEKGRSAGRSQRDSMGWSAFLDDGPGGRT